MRKLVLFSLLIILVFQLSGQQSKNVTNNEVLAAMKKASAYMVETVSYKGGYLWKYSEDLSEREGETPARKCQISTYGPGTQRMGHLFLDLYSATGDSAYLGYAKKAANALVYGQHPLGGWHYFIDFDKRGIETYYRDVASRFPSGMEEYRHYYGNCTFDDGATQEPTAFLLRLYMETLLPEYFEPLQKALNFMLMAQYPSGGWPQRYPLRYESVHEGLPDYSSNYTLNDNAMTNTINVLLDAYVQLGDEKYLEAARRGGDFFIIAQGPEGHEGWSEQYDMNLQPSWARTHEPPGYMPRQTIVTISTLEKLFLFTGDRRYLRPISSAIQWLENSRLQVLDDGRSEFSRIYDPETNLPVNRRDTDDPTGEGYTLHHFYLDDTRPFTGERTWHNLEQVIAQYEKVQSVAKEDEQVLYNQMFGPRKRMPRKPGEKKIADLINSLNQEGAWIEDIQMWDVKAPGQMICDRKTIRGISTDTYMRNMRLLMAYVD